MWCIPLLAGPNSLRAAPVGLEACGRQAARAVAAAAVDAEAACMPVHGPSSAECVCLLRHRVVLCCCHQVTDEEPTKEQLRLLHATIKKVGERDSLACL